jgi:TP901 family phage tail tape measure protein
VAVDVGSATGYLDLDISGFLANLRTAQSEADRASKNMATKVGNNITGIGKSMTSVGSTLTKSVTVPLLGIGTAGLKVASDFDSAMSGVKAISGATGEEFDALRAKAIELGGSTAFNANEVAEAMTEMAKAGWDSQQILDGMGGVLDAAAASGENLGTVSTIVADAITGFGMEAKESTRVADLLTQAANSGTIGINDLGESFKYIAPVAGSMGLSIEDVTTALSAMSMSGIKGSQAGTSLRGVLTRMVKPTDQVAAAMDELGIVLTNSDGTFKSLDQILSEMRGSFSGLTDEQKTYYAATLAGQEGMSGLLSLLNMSQDEYDEIAASMDNAGGVAKETAEVMRDNLSADVEELMGSLESLAITLASLIVPALRDFVQWLTQLINKFTSLSPETQKTILTIAGIAAAIGPVLMVLGKLTTSVGSIITTFGKIPGAIAKAKSAFTAVSAAIGGISAPVVAVVAVIAVLIAAFVNLWKTNEEFRNKMTAIWDGIKSKFESFAQGIVDRLNALGFDFENFGEVVKAIWDGFCSLLAPIFEGVFNQVSVILGSVLDALTGIFDVFIGIFTGNWDQAWQGVKEIFGAVWDLIKGTFESWAIAFKGIADTVLNWFGTTWDETWTNIKQFFVDIWNGITSFFLNVINSIKMAVSNFIMTIINFFAQLPTNIANFITNAYNSVVTWVSNMVAKAREMGQNFLNVVVSFFTQLPGKVLQFITSALNNVTIWVTNMGNKAREMGTNFINNVVSFMQQLPGKIKQYLDSAINNLKTWVTQMGQKGREAVQSLINNVISAASGIASKVASIGSDIVSGVWNGIKGAAGWFKDQVTSFFSGIVDGVKDALGIGSPSKVFRDEIGKWLPPGVAQGFEAAMPSAMKAIQKDLNKGIDNIDTDDISVGADIAVSGFADKLKSIYNDVALWFESIEARIDGSIQKMTESLAGLISQGRLIVNSDGTLGYIGYNGFTRVPTSNDDNRYGGNDRDNKGGGDTFIFNSPKAIDEIEAARQMKQTKRDIAEGF